MIGYKKRSIFTTMFWLAHKITRALDNNSEFKLLTVCCSCVFADCSFTLGSASPNNTAGTNALRKNRFIKS